MNRNRKKKNNRLSHGKVHQDIGLIKMLAVDSKKKQNKTKHAIIKVEALV